jgi:hypothetical protein
MSEQNNFRIELEEDINLKIYEDSLDREIESFWGIESLKTSFGFAKNN